MDKCDKCGDRVTLTIPMPEGGEWCFKCIAELADEDIVKTERGE
jgi:hypothetical protein